MRLFAFCSAILIVATANPAFSQERGGGPVGGRVAGLAITLNSTAPNGGGFDVEFAVTMTTTKRLFDSGRGIFGISDFNGVTLNTTATSASGSGRLGDKLSYFQATATGSEYFSSENFVNQSSGGNTTANFYNFSGYLNERRAMVREFRDGQLPGIDYGDGMTINSTELALSTRTTATPTVRGAQIVTSTWRRAFSHAYADAGPYTIEAASRCCAPRERGTISVNTGTIVDNTTTVNGTWQRTQVSSFSSAEGSVVYTSTDRGKGTGNTGSFQRVSLETFSDGPGEVNQVVNRLSVGGNPLAVPTASGVALGVFAAGLFLFGLAILKRS